MSQNQYHVYVHYQYVDDDNFYQLNDYVDLLIFYDRMNDDGARLHHCYWVHHYHYYHHLYVTPMNVVPLTVCEIRFQQVTMVMTYLGAIMVILVMIYVPMGLRHPMVLRMHVAIQQFRY